jgi:hypothetical protein
VAARSPSMRDRSSNSTIWIVRDLSRGLLDDDLRRDELDIVIAGEENRLRRPVTWSMATNAAVAQDPAGISSPQG